MKPIVTISHDDKLINATFTDVMSSTDMIDYFERFLTEIPSGAGYHEVVNFTGVTKFEITHSDFIAFANKAAQVFQSKRVAVTEFVYTNPMQLGMARMFSMMAEKGEVQFLFTPSH